MSQRSRWYRSRALSLAVGVTVVLAIALPVLANLSGSAFEGNDGNLVVNTAGNTDWVNAPNRVRGDDLASGQSDNSFGQGTKEDNASVTVVTGSIPPQKSDLTRFYVGSEFASGSNFLYLAWERSNVLGSANMDFEINKLAQPDLTTTGAKTLNRSPGDMLVTFDFTNGGGNPVLGLLRWMTSANGSAADCFSANALPCWGAPSAQDALDGINDNRVDLSSAGFAEGGVNAGTVTDPIANVSLPGLTFGEAAINLTAAGVFPSNTCSAFGSAFLKSRSSASFPAEVKDFVAPQPVNISNCGTIKIHKVTENGDGTFGYTTQGLGGATFNLSNGGTKEFDNVPPGSSSVTESTLPTDWTLKSLVCTATGSGTSATPSGDTVSITMAPGGVVDCTYTNHTKVSPSIITTLSATTANIGDLVHDSSTLSGATADAGGTVTYTAYSDSSCSQNAQDAGTKTATNGVVPDSNPISFSAAGSYYWQASYSGDANNKSATSVCTSEVVLIKTNPSISTTLSATSVSIGDKVHDSATISGATSDAGGTVSYTVYSDSACTKDAQDAGTKTVTNGIVPDSNEITFNNAGSFYWQAVYSGDTKNNGATSVCTEEKVVVNPNTPGMTTAQDLIPNDSATLTAATSNAGGTITFNLYSPSDATCSGSPAYTQTVNVSGNNTYKTTNSTFHATDTGTWRWQVSYTGDNNNQGATSACGVERFTITNS
jgi:hypothetical protein